MLFFTDAHMIDSANLSKRQWQRAAG